MKGLVCLRAYAIYSLALSEMMTQKLFPSPNQSPGIVVCGERLVPVW